MSVTVGFMTVYVLDRRVRILCERLFDVSSVMTALLSSSPTPRIHYLPRTCEISIEPFTQLQRFPEELDLSVEL